MAARISKRFKRSERDGLEKALRIADVKLGSIIRTLTDLTQQSQTAVAPSWPQINYLQLLNEVFQIKSNGWGLDSDAIWHVKDVMSAFMQAKQILDYKGTIFTRIEEESNTTAQAINPVSTSYFLIRLNNAKLEIQVNVTAFYGSLVNQSSKHSFKEWRRYAFDGDFARATILVHEAIHHLFGLVGSGEISHFCGAHQNPSRDAYSYQRFMIGYETPSFIRPEGILGPPKEVVCSALNGRSHLLQLKGGTNRARSMGPQGINA